MTLRKPKLSKTEREMMFDLFERAEQLSLQGGNQETLSDFEFRFRMHLKEVLEAVSKRASKPMTRGEIAAGMTKLLGRKITKDHIDQWTALSAIQKRMHIDALKALCEIIEDPRPLYFFVEACGFKALHPEEAVYAEFGFKMMMKKMIDEEIKETTSKADMGALRKQAIKRMNNGGL